MSRTNDMAGTRGRVLLAVILATGIAIGLGACDTGQRPGANEPSLAERIAAGAGGSGTDAGTPGAGRPGGTGPSSGDRATGPVGGTNLPPALEFGPPRPSELPVAALAPPALAGPVPAPPPAAPAAPPRTELPSVEVLQAAVIALGDEIIDLVVVATDRIEDETTDVAERRRAHEIKLAIARATVNTVAGPSAFAALVDLVTKTTLLARAAEVAAPARFGGKGELLITALRQARNQAQAAAERLMTGNQAAELKAVLQEATVSVTDLVFVAQISVHEYVAGFDSASGDQRQRRRLSLLSLLAIDPLANLDPTTRELKQSRLLGERALYQAQRTGRILRWEVEGLLYDLLGAPETQSVLQSVDRASRTSQTVADVVSTLPETVASERTALLEEVDAIVTRQRTALLEETEAAVARQRTAAIEDLQAAVATERRALRDDIAAAEGPLVRTMDATRATVEEATQLSESLEETLVQFDSLMARLGVDATAPEPPDEEDEDRTPFDIAVYGAVANDIGQTAQQVTSTLRAFEAILDKPLLTPGARAAGGADGGEPGRSSAADVPAALALQETGTALLNGLLVRGAGLIVLAGITAFAVGLGLRRMRRPTKTID